MRKCLSVIPLVFMLCFAFNCQKTEEVAEEAAVDIAAKTGSIPVGKFNLKYYIEGTGIPTIVIGFPTTYQRSFSQNLRSHLRFVFLDHRGTAPSPGNVDNSEFAMEILIDDIEKARQTLKLDRIAVLGHSGHSYMALEYAKKYPANVSHVIMIGIAPDLGEKSAEAAEEYWQKMANLERKAAMEENLRLLPDAQLAQMSPSDRFKRSYIRNSPRAWYDPHFDPTPLFEGVVVNMDMIDYVWGELFQEIDITPGLENFGRPVFLALGRYDFLVAPPSSWDPILSKFQDITVKIFEKSGHWPFLEEQDLFDKTLIDWINNK